MIVNNDLSHSLAVSFYQRQVKNQKQTGKYPGIGF